jgi:acetolactate synthase-like protein
MNGGEVVARALEAHGVPFLFTLCGGHISPILVEAKRRGIRVVDTRHEATAVFAADAVARLTGRPGVAAVTAGPGATNTITAVKNAQMAQSPVVVLGGATATMLKGRGALQDIDQMELMEPHVKWATTVKQVRELAPTLARAMETAAEGVPGPVFVECPVDLLYGEELVRSWYEEMAGSGGGLMGRAVGWYLDRHLDQLFAVERKVADGEPAPPEVPEPDPDRVERAATELLAAERPVLVVGSQALLEPNAVEELAAAVERLGIPTYLSGMARGLLGAGHPLQRRHGRRKALRGADLVLLAGVPCDFRLGYGRHIGRCFLISANRSLDDLFANRRPDLAVAGDPGRFLRALAEAVPAEERWPEWGQELGDRDRERDEEIAAQAEEETEGLNPLALCRAMEAAISDDSVLVADGGDFVATASYILSPRGPLRWLDPGAFGTLGVGAGFALGAALTRPGGEVWLLYGDGSAGYSLAEIDTFVRHGLGVIAVVGNDASWRQIAREQVEVLEDDVGTVLRHTDYHRVAEGFGGRGLQLERIEEAPEVLAKARELAAAGEPVVVNAILGKTDFRKGSISM